MKAFVLSERISYLDFLITLQYLLLFLMDIATDTIRTGLQLAHMQAHACPHTHACTHMHACMHAHTWMHAHKCTHMHPHARTHARMHTPARMHTHAHILTVYVMTC